MPAASTRICDAHYTKVHDSGAEETRRAHRNKIQLEGQAIIFEAVPRSLGTVTLIARERVARPLFLVLLAKHGRV